MNEDVKTTYGVDEDEPILPSGWSEGDDIFQSDTWTGDDGAVDGQADQTDSGDDGTEVETAEDSDPTTAEEDVENSPNDGEGTDDTQSGQTEPTQDASPKTYRLRVNHQDRDVTLSDDEVIARLQKSYAWDAMQEQRTKAKFKEIYQEQIDAGLTPAAARMVAQNECGGQSFEIGEDGEIVEPAGSDTQVQDSQNPDHSVGTKDLAAQIQQVKEIFGDFTEVPEEVANAVARGADLFTAYTAYRLRESNKAAASLKKENEVLKQNAASAARAPVRGVTGGGATNQKKESDFLKGFNSEEW